MSDSMKKVVCPISPQRIQFSTTGLICDYQMASITIIDHVFRQQKLFKYFHKAGVFFAVIFILFHSPLLQTY